jgi:hypothetical protein
VTVESRHLYAAGFALALVVGVATAASLVLAELPAYGALVFAGQLTFVFGLVGVYRDGRVDRERSLVYRVGNWGGALLVVALGLLMVAVGVASVGFFG